MTTIGILRNKGDQQHFASGQTIFSEGEPGDVMYVIAEGELEVRARDRVIETIGAGQLIGEMALIDAQPRSATVIARTDCALIPVDSRRFLRLVQHTPYFALQVMQVLADRLRRQTAAQ